MNNNSMCKKKKNNFVFKKINYLGRECFSCRGEEEGGVAIQKIRSSL